MSIFRVGLVTLVLVVLGMGAVAVGVAVDSGAKAKSPRAVTARRDTPQSRALSPEQQKKVAEARKQFMAERKAYQKLRATNASEKQLEAQRAKVEKAGEALRALGVEPMRGRMLDERGGCNGGDGCSHGAKGEGRGGCRMGSGSGGCSMGTKEQSPNHNAAAPRQKEARANQAGKSASRATGHAGRATGHGGAAVEREGDAAGHDGGHSAHGGAAKAQGVRPISSVRFGRGASEGCTNDCCQQHAAQCGGEDCQGCCGDCTCGDGEHGEETSIPA